MKLKHDTLSVEIEMEVRKEYKKISKHKRVLMPVLDYRVDLYVNGHKFDEDEVFVEKVFFQSLLSQANIRCLHARVEYLAAGDITWMFSMKMTLLSGLQSNPRLWISLYRLQNDLFSHATI